MVTGLCPPKISQRQDAQCHHRKETARINPPEPPVEAEGTLVVAQKWGVTAHGYSAVWADGNVVNLTAVVVAHIWEYTENHSQWVRFMMCELDPSNTVKTMSSGPWLPICATPWFW